MSNDSFTYVNEEFPLILDGVTVAYLDLSCEIDFSAEGSIEDVSYIYLGSMILGTPPIRVRSRHMLYDAIIERVGKMWDAGEITPPEELALPSRPRVSEMV
jgi:hypothetical protein